jgi:LytS/YehU family sensor histidine kinase
MTVDFSVTGKTADKNIPPLLLMTFAENVFKYGISSHEESDIVIKLVAEEHNVNFYCRNKLFGTKRNTERTGIGIANATKRLQHLYPNKHFLDIKKEEGFFTVHLTLQA